MGTAWLNPPRFSALIVAARPAEWRRSGEGCCLPTERLGNQAKQDQELKLVRAHMEIFSNIRLATAGLGYVISPSAVEYGEEWLSTGSGIKAAHIADPASRYLQGVGHRSALRNGRHGHPQANQAGHVVPYDSGPVLSPEAADTPLIARWQ